MRTRSKYGKRTRKVYSRQCHRIFNFKRKERATRFKKGCIPHNKGRSQPRDNDNIGRRTIRLTSDEFRASIIEDGRGCYVPFNPSDSLDGILLRPRHNTATDELTEMASYIDPVSELDTNRVVHLQKTLEMMNEANHLHLKHAPNCEHDLTVLKEEPFGLGTKISLNCKGCAYQSRMYKLYTEIPSSRPGRKAAAMNRAIHLGAQGTGISAYGLRTIFTAANIPSPHLRGMYKNVNLVADLVANLNKEDMVVKRRQIRNINEALGRGRDAPISASFDSQYNNALFSGAGRTPFQTGTQASATLCENETMRYFIIALSLFNKHCKVKNCNHGPGNCTLTMAIDDIIGDERRAGRECAEQLHAEEPLSIQYLTTDGDSCGYLGIKGEQEKSGSATGGPQIERLSDPSHLNRSMKRCFTRTEWSDDFFGQNLKQTVRKKYMQRIKNDVPERCSAELRAAYQKYKGNLRIIAEKMVKVMDAIVNCYKGKCDELCKKHSLVCCGVITSGSIRAQSWQLRSPYLKTLEITLNMTSSDEYEFRDILQMRLGEQAVYRARFNTHTQINEALHRKYSAANPKTILRSRNFGARVHHQVHSHNNGMGASTIEKLRRIGAPLTGHTRVTRQLQRQQKEFEYSQRRHRSFRQRFRRKAAKEKLYELYDRKSEIQEKETRTYRKGMLDRSDHSYSRASRSTH